MSIAILGAVLTLLATACSPSMSSEPAVQNGTISDGQAGELALGLNADCTVMPVTCLVDAPKLVVPAEPATETLLPGESTACAALGIVACRHGCVGLCDSAASLPSYQCYGADGQIIKLGKDDWCQDGSPCSEAQAQAWVNAYPKCIKFVPSSAIPPSLLGFFMEPAAIPPTVCSNAAGSMFWLVSACALHEYSLVDDDHCGNIGGGHWSLVISPPTTATLRTAKYPFLACNGYSAALTHCRGLSVAEQSGSRVVEGGYGCGGAIWDPVAGPEWAQLLDKAASAFTTCSAKYDWTYGP